MIGRINGILLAKRAPEILVDVAGVGYEIQVPMTTLFQLPELGSQLLLFTHFVVREDAQQLYGFVEERDRTLFRSLIKVNGVGPRLALTILSGMDAESFVHCVRRDDVATLMQLPGVGKKTAERLLIEMRDRLKDWMLDPSRTASGGAARLPQGPDIVADAERALVALGYKPQEASRAVSAVRDDTIDNSEELIRRALKSMVSA